jgi:hypothetical protein
MAFHVRLRAAAGRPFQLASASVLAFVLLVLAPVVGANADHTKVHPDARSVEPLSVGTRVPNPSLRTVAGDAVDLDRVLQDGGALLVFYRGGW